MKIESNRYIQSLIKSVAFCLGVSLLMGCDDAPASNKHTALLKTKATVKAELIASEYQIEVVFKAEAKTQELATKVLAERLVKFEAWVAKQALVMTGGTAKLSAVYQYSSNEKRKLTGYEALQRFNMAKLNFDQYQIVMGNGAKYQPFSIQLMAVVASEQDKSKAKKDLIKKAFTQAKEKAVAMSKAAALCEVTVSEMSENLQDHSSPRMMKMSMESDRQHHSESKQTITLNLNVNWMAQPC
jgi:uncharacterized protein YggE